MNRPASLTGAASAATDLLAGANRRRALFFFLYVCEGAPFGFIWWMLPVLLREAGNPVARITTLTALATLPWTVKFLAAPLIDYSSARGLALRWWISAMQLGMVLALLPVLGLDLAAGYPLLLVCLVAHSSFGALQDVAVDTLAMRTAPANELGSLNGWMQAGMLAGRAITAGLGLGLASRFGVDAVIAGLAGLLALSALSMPWLLRHEPRPVRHQPRELLRELRILVSGRGFWFAAVFALTAGAAFEAFGALGGPMFTDLGWPRETIARVFAILSPVAMVIGALGGGMLADRLGRLRVCAGIVAVLAVSAVAMSRLPQGAPGMIGELALVAWYLLVGMLTAVSYSLFMQVSAGTMIAATQFSVFMAMTNACEVWSGFLGGQIAEVAGYAMALALMALLSLLALPALLGLRRQGGAGNGP